MLRKKLLPSKNHQCVANRFAPPNLLSPPGRFEIEPAKRKKRHAQHTYPVIQFAAKRCLNWITAESMEVGKNGKGFTFFNPGLSGTARFSEVVFFLYSTQLFSMPLRDKWCSWWLPTFRVLFHDIENTFCKPDILCRIACLCDSSQACAWQGFRKRVEFSISWML